MAKRPASPALFAISLLAVYFLICFTLPHFSLLCNSPRSIKQEARIYRSSPLMSALRQPCPQAVNSCQQSPNAISKKDFSLFANGIYIQTRYFHFSNPCQTPRCLNIFTSNQAFRLISVSGIQVTKLLNPNPSASSWTTSTIFMQLLKVVTVARRRVLMI
jgi:hypothetical protein